MARKPRKNELVESDDVSLETGSVSTAADGQAVQEVAASADAEVQEPKTKCGGALNIARESQGLTIQDVAKQLRLGVRQIEALETDNFAILPEATIVKGFIRNYAKLLKISSEPLIAAYNEIKPDKEQHAYTLNPGINMKISEHKQSDMGRYFVLTFVILIVAGIWFFYQNYVQKPSPVNPIPEIVEALPELALPATERIQDDTTYQLEMPEQDNLEVSNETASTEAADVAVSQESAAASVNDAEQTTTTEAVATEQPVAELEVTASEGEVAVDAATAPTPGKTRLAFTATQETWLSVVNASGQEVYNKILYAGNHDVIDVWQPAEIVVGNAHGATLVVDGKAIDLAPYTRINVARVRLDR
jgi:cytoskeleton protein RodZ